ncbi:MAG: CDP-alcohol phosphatidyltransferase family protein [Tenericutes bacterium]|nr:CDP-alcohol phosphatidyltransferase family protein [Mycoplasmatota bacterium]
MKHKLIKIIEIAVVNVITIFRLIGAIILPFVYFNKGTSTAAIFILVLFLTDAIDGFLARTFKVSTFFGSSMDALSDKVLNAIALIILSIEHRIMLAPLILEVSIILTTYSTYRFGGNVQSSKIGKIKTIVLDVFVILSYILISMNSIEIKNIVISHIIKNTDAFIGLFGGIITILSIIALIDYNKKNKLTRNHPKLVHVKYLDKERKSFKEIIRCSFDTEYYKAHKNESIMKQFYKRK